MVRSVSMQRHVRWATHYFSTEGVHRCKAALAWPIYLAVAGDSMAPALSAGNWIIAARTGRARPGDVVVLAHPDRPGLLVVKRVIRVGSEGFWVQGDNAVASTDSRHFGPVPTIIGRVLWRVRPWGPVR